MVFVDDIVVAMRTRSSRLAEADVRTRHLLQFNGCMLHDMAEPRALAFRPARHESAGGLIRAAMLCEARQIAEQTVYESLAEPPGRPFLQHAQIDGISDDREMGVNVGAFIRDDRLDFHRMISYRCRITLRRSDEERSCQEDAWAFFNQLGILRAIDPSGRRSIKNRDIYR